MQNAVINSETKQLELDSICTLMEMVSPNMDGAAVAEWLSSWLAEQEDRGSIPGLATWIFRDWLSPASKSRYGWKIAKSTLILKTTNQPKYGQVWFPLCLNTFQQILNKCHITLPMNIGKQTVAINWFVLDNSQNYTNVVSFRIVYLAITSASIDGWGILKFR